MTTETSFTPLGDEEQALHWVGIATEKAPHEAYISIFEIKTNVLEDAVLEQPDFVELRSRLGLRK